MEVIGIITTAILCLVCIAYGGFLAFFSVFAAQAGSKSESVRMAIFSVVLLAIGLYCGYVFFQHISIGVK